MTERLEVYKCAIYGNITEVLHKGKGQIWCCGLPMKLCSENTVDAAPEKHVPAVQKVDDGVNVTAGSVPHPMEAKHYIQWIEIIAETAVFRQHLKPSDPPKAAFKRPARPKSGHRRTAICTACGRRRRHRPGPARAFRHVRWSPETQTQADWSG